MSGFSTQGNKILKPDGSVASLNGLSWFGFESGIFIVHGIWQRSMDDMLDQIKSLGYNLLRIPYSNEMLTKTAADLKEGIDYSKNLDLVGLSPLEMLDVLIKKAEARGIYILLDRHQYQSGGGNGDHWVSWDQGIGEDKWISDWVMLANRYKDHKNILGADLANEPHTTAVTWQNWVAAATKCGNAILSANPDWLIIVEGIETYNGNSYWWGGQLQGVKDLQVLLDTPNKVVYSPHDYGPDVYNQSWFQDPKFPANLPDVWDTHFGYIAKQGIAPVLVGEFGGRSTDTSTREGQWQNALVDYIRVSGLYWVFWCLNNDSGDTGGLLQGDWVSVNTDKQAMLERLFVPAPQPPATPPVTTPTATPAPIITPTPTATPVITPSNPVPSTTTSTPTTTVTPPSTPPVTTPVATSTTPSPKPTTSPSVINNYYQGVHPMYVAMIATLSILAGIITGMNWIFYLSR